MSKSNMENYEFELILKGKTCAYSPNQVRDSIVDGLYPVTKEILGENTWCNAYMKVEDMEDYYDTMGINRMQLSIARIIYDRLLKPLIKQRMVELRTSIALLHSVRVGFMTTSKECLAEAEKLEGKLKLMEEFESSSRWVSLKSLEELDSKEMSLLINTASEILSDMKQLYLLPKIEDLPEVILNKEGKFFEGSDE